jgi:stage II sporulation protein D
MVQRTGWALPTKVELRVYPDLEAFRNATGEPGWVAGYTSGRRINLQPMSVLRAKGALESTLSHELLHVFVESQAKAGLPLWFREGLTEYLQNGRGSGVPQVPAEADLRETADIVRARRAYANARAEVALLVQHYGETAVLDWLKRGLPADVAKASASSPATNNK